MNHNRPLLSSVPSLELLQQLQTTSQEGRVRVGVMCGGDQWTVIIEHSETTLKFEI
jgi:hypothetical protein